jgi:uncharacterized cupin superfamily protein
MGLLRLTPAGAGDQSRPDPARLVAGDPVQTTWVVEARAGLWAGLWECSPGKWRVVYDEWEYCRVLSGVSVVVGEDGQAVTLRAGDSLVLRPGFRGTWEVVETTRKEFVILDPAPPPA